MHWRGARVTRPYPTEGTTIKHITAVLVAAIAILTLPTVASAKPPTSSSLPLMTSRDARHYSATALRRVFKGEFYGGSLHATCKNVTRARKRCTVSWYQGDAIFTGHTEIWYALNANHEVWWNYGYKITRVDDYCYRVEHRPLASCSRHYAAT